MKKIVMYSKHYCGYCDRARALLKQRGLPFEEIKLDPAKNPEDEERMRELIERSGMRTVPQIFADDALIGGYTELAALDAKDGLASLKA